jgi:hypothetical protein
MRKTRVISKTKTYGFNPYMDQIDTINQIMKGTGEKTESVLLRQLIDEALAARHKRDQSISLNEESGNELGDRLRRIESLLMQIVREEDVLFRIQDVCLALLQDVLAEAHATRSIAWESLVKPQLQAKGLKDDELEQRFILQADQAKEFSYRVALRIKESQKTR